MNEPEPPTASPPEAAAVLSEVRRSLEDLLLFEGRWFVTPAEAAGDREPAPGAAAELAAFHDEICQCTRCPLGHTRTRFVFGSGDPEAGIMFVGEAPGEEEDRQGLPFVGAAGQLLTRIIEAIELSREEVYICNVLKCRPPGNRDPLPEETAACDPWLTSQIEIIDPKVIVTLGRHSLQRFLPGAAISKAHGQPRQVEGRTVMPVHHPAAALYQQSLRATIEADFKKIPDLIAQTAEVKPAEQEPKQLGLF